ncbi:diguanylate cyclase [Telmatospirillum sp.]|uniref:diguanylate cyclase n=1 Tax=Telmatospirillum sp. TaxID=2079197 RepID=UPI00283B57D1|nr:diguanylate cyclase [Telmatospirillum sp.]MDR3437720.1 diguanylate cyclase [Telmatospirillum sp.]
MAALRQILTFLAALLTIAVIATDSIAADGWDRLRTIVFSNLGRAEGLPHPVTMALTQDGDGFLWVGTQGGLSRYDGYRFRTFFHRDEDLSSLPGNTISDLTTDSAGRLWVGTLSGGVARFDPATEQFRSFPAPSGGSARGSVWRLVGDGGEGVWVGTNNGLEHIDSKSGTVTRYVHRDGDAGSLPNDRIRSLLRTRDGTLWVASYQGLVRYRNGAFEPVKVIGGQGQAVDDVIVAFAEDSAGRVWFSTSRSGLGKVDPMPGTASGWSVARLLPPIGPATLSGPLSFTLMEGRKGEIWVGGLTGGITVISAETGAVIRTIHHDLALSGSLADDSVRGLLRDRSGLIWAGTNVGVSVTNLANDAIDTIMPSSGTVDGLPDANVLAVDQTPDGRAWLGLKGSGVAVLDPKRGTFDRLPQAPDLATGAVVGFAVEPNGGVWIGANSGRVLYRYDQQTQRVVQRPFPHGDGGQILSGVWYAGALWFAAGPLVRYDPATGETRVYRHGSDPASLVDDSINVMLPAGEGAMWVATRHGLDYFDLSTEQFRHFTHDRSDPQSLPEDLVSTLLIDRRGRLWVGTLGGGIGVMETVDGRSRFHRLSSPEGLPNVNIGTLLEDHAGRIWASTADGIAVIDPDNLSIQALGRGDGVAIPAYWVHSGAALPDGTLLFGGGGGLTVVHPDRLTTWAYRAPAVVTGVRVNGHAVPVAPGGGATALVLAPSERNIEVEFAVLDYSAPDRLRYAYKLEGFDEDWITTDVTRRVAAYTNLSPAHYRLLVRGTNRDGVATDAVELPIIVQPAWWQTLWFRFLLVLLFLAGMAGLVYGRTAFLERRRRLLEELVARQTQDLIEANRRLEELASRDSLTEIYNRRCFLELAERELERTRRLERSLSLLMIDVDHFKRVNDTQGHASGDQVLCAIVATIKAALRTSDLFARLGGEELVVLMPETDGAAAMVVAERLRSAVAVQEHPMSAGGALTVTISVGLATLSGPSETLATLLDRADRALYAAKRAGRNRVIEAPGSEREIVSP